MFDIKFGYQKGAWFAVASSLVVIKVANVISLKPRLIVDNMSRMLE